MKPMRVVSEWLETWLAWLPVTGVAWALALVLAWGVASGLGAALPSTVSWAVGGLAGGALLGAVQWLALKPETRGAGRWMLTTAVGWVAGLAVAALPVQALGPLWGRLVGAVLGGLLMGGCQWLALQPEARRPGWVITSAAGWGAAIAVSLAVDMRGWETLGGTILNMAAAGALGLALIGLVAVLARFLLFPDVGKKYATTYERWWP